jgi:hypothetical protein
VAGNISLLSSTPNGLITAAAWEILMSINTEDYLASSVVLVVVDRLGHARPNLL